MPTRHVVLAHGIFRFDMVRVLFRDRAHIDIGPHYFVGIADFLRQHGLHRPRVRRQLLRLAPDARPTSRNGSR